MSPTRLSQSLRGNCALGEWSHALRIRGAMSRLTVGRRWSRSVAMDAASTSPILSIVQLMTNFIPTGSRAGWSRSTPPQRAGSHLTKTSFSPGPRATCRIRCAFKAGTRPRIHIAIRQIEGTDRCVPKSKSGVLDAKTPVDVLAVAQQAIEAFSRGEVELCQQRIKRGGEFRYLAIKKHQKRIPLVNGTPSRTTAHATA